jgi:UDP-N-acetylmuramyl-tripeptide synthetase
VKNENVSSFMGLLPAERPEIGIIVVLDNPHPATPAHRRRHRRARVRPDRRTRRALSRHPPRRRRRNGLLPRKTTVAFLIRDILRAPAGNAALSARSTTSSASGAFPPRAPRPSRSISSGCSPKPAGGVRAMSMEVSSQGLVAERLRGTRFAAAVFTNLSVDHLDFHKTMEAYFDAKKRLFADPASLPPGAPAIVNLDDPYGRRLAAEPFMADRLLAFGGHPDAQVRAENIRLSETGSAFRAVTPWGGIDVEMGLAGRFNVSNALAAMAVCGALGAPLDAMAAALSKRTSVPGRLERIADPRGRRHLFVDYAHTEDALRNVLQTLRETAPGRLVCVFGCGGNRDRSKRPRMGAAVSEFADLAIATSDNPRDEDPAAILEEIRAGWIRPSRISSSPTAPRRSAPPCAKPVRATPCSLPARDTKPIRKSPAAWCISTIAKFCAKPWPTASSLSQITDPGMAVGRPKTSLYL